MFHVNQKLTPYLFNPFGYTQQIENWDRFNYGKVTHYYYAKGSGVLSRIDEAGLQTVLEYDEMGRVSKRSRLNISKSSDSEQLVDDEHYLYDANGRLSNNKIFARHQ